MLKSTKTTPLNFWANFLLIFGSLGLLLSFYLIFQRYNPQNLSFQIGSSKIDYKVSDSEIAEPVGVKINSANIALPIIPSKIDDNKWESTTKGASFLKTSVNPGEIGNSILYGHNWPNLLGNLTKVKPGDKVTVFYADNSTRDFLVEYTAQVRPEDITILKNSEDRRITLYTCTGFLDSKRFVVVAKLLV